MDEKYTKLLFRAGAEICKFLGSYLATATPESFAYTYVGLSVLQILMTVFLGSVPGGTAARRVPRWKKVFARL